jgi:hypothetical protein
LRRLGFEMRYVKEDGAMGMGERETFEKGTGIDS